MSNVMSVHDGAVQALMAKLPLDIRNTFSADQLHALNQALNAPKRQHAVHLRWQLGFWRWKFYFNLILGRDRRDLTRSQELTKGWVLAIIMWGLIFITTLFWLLVLYLIKSAMGIDIFPHFSLGIWSWFKETYLN
jgi:hypothetical protein